MISSRRLDARYSRILGFGIAVSLAAHAAVFAFGHFTIDSDEVAEPELKVVTLADVEVAPEEWERLEIDLETSAVVTAPLLVSEIKLDEMLPSVGEPTDESATVLAMAANAALELPVVPRPRAEPATVESGLTPIHVLEPIAIGVNQNGRSNGGGFTIAVVGGGNCGPPAFVNRRYPTSRVRLIGSR